jgi:hypothetical protein
LTVVLYSIKLQEPYLELKIYGPEDLQFMQVVHKRVQTTLTHFLEDGLFDDKDMCSILASFIFYMECIGDWFNSLIGIFSSDDDDCPKEIFTTSEIDTYKSYLNDYLTKYNIEKIIEKDSDASSDDSDTDGYDDSAKNDADGSDEKS